jgi:hypothetical protein
MVKAERRYPLRWIVWPQPVDIATGHIGLSSGETITCWSLKQYQRIAAKIPRAQELPSRAEFGRAWRICDMR